MMRALKHVERAHRARAWAYLEGGIRFWMWLIDTSANIIIALMMSAIGQLAFLYRMAQMRSAVVSFGRWGGFYASGNYAYRLCLGFMAITWLPLDVDAALVDIGSGRPRHLGLSVLLSQSDRQIGGYTRYTLRAWARGYAIALLLADIDDIWGS
jgi:hypothetical protein